MDRNTLQMSLTGMRGLLVFITDIRNCQNKEQERLRVDKELANIRTKFKSERNLTAYDRKKYVWKMLYIYMLGYDVDFGHMEAISLISASKYGEKQVGYIVTSCLLNENNDFLRLVINTVRNDVIGRNETFQCLALTMVANVGGKEFADSLATDVQKLLLTQSVRPIVRKKAALCLLRLFRKSPDSINSEGWSDKMATLLEERDIGVLTSIMSLLVALLSTNPEGFYACLPKCVKVLDRLVCFVDIPQEYTYYGIPCPWLQVKTMRALQYYPSIEDPNIRQNLYEILHKILRKTEMAKNVNKNNANYAVLFEALALAMHMEGDKDLISKCVSHLGSFLSVREPNIRYLGLENIARMLIFSEVQENIRNHQSQIVNSLKDADISIRRRALDLLYGMCDVNNAKSIVEEILQYLTTADFIIREELALKAAVLAEKFSPNLSWYVDVILQLIEKAGDFVSDDVWHRVVQYVTNNEDLQKYAVTKMMSYLNKPGVHETMVKVSGYILGEFSHLMSTEPGFSPMEVFSTIHDKFHTVSIPTKALLLSTYVKLLMHNQPTDPELQDSILAVFKKHENFMDAEVQQRAVEYLTLFQKGPSMADILSEMPKFPVRESALEKKVEEAEGDSAEISATKLRSQSMSQAIIVSQFSQQSLPQIQRPVLSENEAQTTKVEEDKANGPSQNGIAPSSPHPSSSITDASSSASPPPPTQAPAAVPSKKSGVDLLSELLEIEAPPAVQQPQLPAGTMPAHPNAYSGELSTPESLALALYETPQTSVQPIGSILEWFRGLIFKNSGVFYEDPYIQIGIKSEYRGAQGRVVIFFGNKDTSPLASVQASVLPCPGLRLFLHPVANVIPPRAQIQVPLDVAAIQPPKEIPFFQISYTLSSSSLTVPLTLALPVVFSKFIQPSQLSSNDFFPKWKALESPPLKLQEVLRGLKPIGISAMSELLASLRIAVCPNLDPNPNNLVACSTLFTETAPPILVLIRIETDPSDWTQLRLTVASSDPAATLGLKEFLKDQLSGRLPAPTKSAGSAMPRSQVPAVLSSATVPQHHTALVNDPNAPFQDQMQSDAQANTQMLQSNGVAQGIRGLI